MSTSMSAGQGARSSGSSAGASFMNVPPTSNHGAISDGYIRTASVERVTALLRNRYRPIYQPGQSRYVGGPNNSGDSSTTAEAQGGGSFSTSTRNS